MELIKCFVTTFDVIVMLIMLSFIWFAVKTKDHATTIGFSALILLYVANIMIMWR